MILNMKVFHTLLVILKQPIFLFSVNSRKGVLRPSWTIDSDQKTNMAVLNNKECI